MPATVWTNLENTLLWKTSQSQKDKGSGSQIARAGRFVDTGSIRAASCLGLKAIGNQELVYNGSEISLWGDENGPEMDGGYHTSV